MDHGLLLGNDFGAAGHTSEMVARVAVVSFDGDGMSFADDMAFGGQHLGESIPIVGVEGTVLQMLDLIVESLEGCSITMAEHPGHGSPRATIHRFDEPDFVFLTR